jgi:hypothetical protein
MPLSHAPNDAVKAKISDIIKEIQKDYWVDNEVFGYVRQLLDPYTNSQIELTSDLINQLGLDQLWIDNYLNMGCNKIVKYLLQIHHTTAIPAIITPAIAKKCNTVQDIVDLIKTTCDEAK